MGETYLLELLETSGLNDYVTQHIIRAEDKQMVKYHYHRTLKTFGYGDANISDKHCLKGPQEDFTEIQQIKHLSDVEASIMQRHLPEWTKM